MDLEQRCVNVRFALGSSVDDWKVGFCLKSPCKISSIKGSGRESRHVVFTNVNVSSTWEKSDDEAPGSSFIGEISALNDPTEEALWEGERGCGKREAEGEGGEERRSGGRSGGNWQPNERADEFEAGEAAKQRTNGKNEPNCHCAVSPPLVAVGAWPRSSGKGKEATFKFIFVDTYKNIQHSQRKSMISEPTPTTQARASCAKLRRRRRPGTVIWQSERASERARERRTKERCLSC